MSTPNHLNEVNDRLRLIESMICEGRRKTGRYGWNFLLWGIAYYVAIGWSNLNHSSLAWPVTMVTAAILSVVFGIRSSGQDPATATGRFLGALWTAGGIALFVYAFGMAYSGHASTQTLIPGVEILLGLVNLASGMVLRWRLQQLCGALWTVAAATSFFVSEQTVSWLFLAAIFFCNIFFGIVITLSEMRSSRSLSPSGSAHA